MTDFDHLRQKIMLQLDMNKSLTDQELFEIIHVLVQKIGRENGLSIKERDIISKDLYASIRGMDILDRLLEDNSITEIMVNGPNQIFVEKNGAIQQTNLIFPSEQRLQDVIQHMVSKANRRVNEATPIVDTRLADGSRVNIVLKPIALNGPIVTIRKFPNHQYKMSDLIENHTISVEAANYLKVLVRAGYNIFVSGGTGSGKTTFLNVLSEYIPKDERVITIEDSAELQIENIPNLVRMEVRQASIDGTNAVTTRDLIKTSLRQNPNRIIVGEVRGDEVVDMLQAMNTGHDGSLSTGHANSPLDMITRLEMMVLMGMDIPLAAVRAQIASALDIIVHVGKVRDKTRKVLDISEIYLNQMGQIQLNSLFHFLEIGEEEGKVIGELQYTKNKIMNPCKIESSGLSGELIE